MTVLNFDARQVAPDPGRGDPVPLGWYNAICESLVHEPTSGGGGEKLSATFLIIDGVYKGRKIFHNFNYVNTSEKAQEIGRAQLSALAYAVGQLMLATTEMACNIPIKIRVKITKDEGYEPKNDITAFKHVKDPTAGDTSGTPKVVSGAAAAGAAKPWENTAPAPVAAAPAPANSGSPAPWQGAGASGAQPWEQDPAPVAQAAPVQAAPAPVTNSDLPPWMQN